jgi:preprotein translocase subunit SecB
MADGGMTANFQFLSYKIDILELKTKNNLEVLEKSFVGDSWNFSVAFRKPVYYSKRQQYVCGLEVTLLCPPPEEGEEGADAMVRIRGGIVGLFKADEGKLDPALEKQLAKIHAPYILLPYLRGAVTSLLANAGIGAVLFPLINLHEVAKTAMAGEELTVIDT